MFKEAVRNKRHNNRSASLRDLLNSSVAEYNRKATTKAIDGGSLPQNLEWFAEGDKIRFA